MLSFFPFFINTSERFLRCTRSNFEQERLLNVTLNGAFPQLLEQMPVCPFLFTTTVHSDSAFLPFALCLQNRFSDPLMSWFREVSLERKPLFLVQLFQFQVSEAKGVPGFAALFSCIMYIC